MLSTSAIIALLSILPLRPDGHEVEVVAHRGANRIAPENTMAAARMCHQLGLDWVEVDVRMSRDGVFYVFHDELLSRTTGRLGLFRVTDSKTIDTLDAGSWFGDHYAGEPVPKLREILEWARGRIRIYLDLKHVDVARLVELLDETEMREDVFAWSGNSGYMRSLREIAPDIKLKCNVRSRDAFDQVKETFDPEIVEVGTSALSKELIAHVQSHGVKVMMYTKAPDADAFRKAIQLGADMVNIDHPRLYIWVERSLQDASDTGEAHGPE